MYKEVVTLNDRSTSVATSDLEGFWLSGSAEEPALELDREGHIKAIRRERAAEREQRRRRLDVQIPEFRWD